MRPDASNPAGDFEVEWFRVPYDREPLGVPTVFTSSAWDPEPFGEELGEQRDTRQWVSGLAPLTLPTTDPPGRCGTDEQWLEGWPVGTPGCATDPLTGECLECGLTAIEGPVALVWLVAQGESPTAVSQVEGASVALGVRRADATGEVYAVSSVAGLSYPNAIAELWGAAQIWIEPTAGTASWVEGAWTTLKIVMACPVAVAWQPAGLVAELLPDAIAYVYSAGAAVKAVRSGAAAWVEGPASSSYARHPDVIGEVYLPRDAGGAPPRYIAGEIWQGFAHVWKPIVGTVAMAEYVSFTTPLTFPSVAAEAQGLSQVFKYQKVVIYSYPVAEAWAAALNMRQSLTGPCKVGEVHGVSQGLTHVP